MSTVIHVMCHSGLCVICLTGITRFNRMFVFSTIHHAMRDHLTVIVGGMLVRRAFGLGYWWLCGVSRLAHIMLMFGLFHFIFPF
jgi:hypothetical protein